MWKQLEKSCYQKTALDYSKMSVSRKTKTRCRDSSGLKENEETWWSNTIHEHFGFGLKISSYEYNFVKKMGKFIYEQFIR